ncbi:protein kinase [Nesterenkonia sp.]|uniref:protein kinase domain-containing protein n=1 Tax=Nesterenkonia sp. TaxID=704201 RepID=UPI002635A1A7|nr:protein kinase [Nesterenkonia sp.]
MDSLVPLKLLGVGGRSAVWLVERTGQRSSSVTWVTGGDAPPVQLALKVPLQAPRTAPSLRSGVQELQAMLPLIHEHLVRPWGLVTTENGPGLLMDAYPAGSLARLLRSGHRLSPGEVVTVFSPVAAALEHVHAHGASHGDVSTANILLSSEGRPVLADLGDAALLGMGASQAAPEADLAALAAAAWEALTGRAPEEGSRRPPLGAVRSDVPAAMVDLLEEALSPSPPGLSAGQFAVELYDAAAAHPVDLTDHVDDETLAELPTRLPASPAPGRFSAALARLRRRLWGPALRRVPTVGRFRRRRQRPS